jgi:hypothetical protein
MVKWQEIYMAKYCNLRALDLCREIVADTLEDGNMYT